MLYFDNLYMCQQVNNIFREYCIRYLIDKNIIKFNKIIFFSSIYLRIAMELICVLFNVNRNIEKLALTSTKVEKSD